MELLQAQDFEPHVGRLFRFEGTPHAFPLDRIDTYAGELPDYVERRPFTLIFHGPKPGAVMAEGLYACAVEGGGRFELYVAPIHTPETDRQDYQSAFN